MTIRVFIPTTDAPVEVLSITEEDPEVDSVMCLGGRAVALRVSSEYAAFVRAPTGIVQRLFGHQSYRMDVSRPIDQGESFHLGALIAHAAHAEGCLPGGGDAAGRPVPPDRPAPPDGLAVWATGEVLRDLSVGPVGFVREKLLRSRGELAALRAAGWPVLLVVPSANRAEVDELLLRDLGVDGTHTRLVAAARVADLELPLGRPLPVRLPGPGRGAGSGAAGGDPARPQADPRQGWRAGRRRRGMLLGGTAAAVLAGLGVATGLAWPSVAGWRALHAEGRLAELENALATPPDGWLPLGMAAQGFARYLDWHRPPATALRLDVAALRPDPGHHCDGTAWPPRQPEHATARAALPVPAPGQGAAASVWLVPANDGEATVDTGPAAPPPRLCGVTLRAEAVTAGGSLPVRAMAELMTPAGDVVAGPWQGPGQRLAWQAEQPGDLPLRYRLVALAPAFGEAAPAGLLPPPGAEAAVWDQAARRLARLGVALVRHEGVIHE